MAVIIQEDDDIIIDPSMLVEPDESDEEETGELENIDQTDTSKYKFGFNGKKLTIEGEGIIDDEEFDEDWEDIYEPYEEDPSLLDEDDDL